MTIRGRLFRLIPPSSSLNSPGNSNPSSGSNGNNVQELSVHEFLDEYVTRKPMVILGEYHGSKPTIQLQTAIQQAMARSLVVGRNTSVSSPKLRVIMEHFSVDMQPLLHRYLGSNSECQHVNNAKGDTMTTQELIDHYHEVGTEQHNLYPYTPLLESVKQFNSVTLHGGFIPRNFARELHILTKRQQQLSQQDKDIIKENQHDDNVTNFLQKMKDLNYISPNESLHGTNEHYNYFESLFTRRNIHQQINEEPSQRFRTLFPAQLLKDASMAWSIHSIAKQLNTTGNDKLFVICGVGHMLYSHGVPERLLLLNKDHSHGQKNKLRERNDYFVTKKDDILRISCLPVSKGTFTKNNTDECKVDVHHDIENISSIIDDTYGSADAADVCFIYEDDDEDDIDEITNAYEVHQSSSISHDKANSNQYNESSEQNNKDDYYIQQETKNVYDRVGSTAGTLHGNLFKARDMLKSLYYTDDEIAYVGSDAVNYQGVGCPHRHANIAKGDFVLDMGSGLGVDSIIASKTVGDSGCVIGVDISSQCVNHANKRANLRGIDSNLLFIHSPIGDVESRLSENGKRSSEMFDVVISNGAFCLLPNKRVGFAECYQLLKKGGRIAICTTVIKDSLNPHVEWPLCMQTFAKLNEIKPMLEELGFIDIEIDLSDSLMEVQEVEDSSLTELQRNLNDEDNCNSTDNTNRYKVHNEDGRKRYIHLENFDMNELCARVVIKARKP